MKTNVIYYYITDDTVNKKNEKLFTFFNEISQNNFILLTPNYCSQNVFGLKQKFFKTNNKLSFLMHFWSKIAYFFSKLPNSSSDIQFPKRNLYSGNIISRLIVSLFWRIKINKTINRILPYYETIYFLPTFILSKKLRYRSNRVFVYDALILRSIKYSYLIASIRKSGSPIINTVASWDNPFYSQFTISSEKYSVWSKQMLLDINKVHKLNLTDDNILLTGPYPFYNFYSTSKIRDRKIIKDEFIIGYACAFCDLIMLEHEIDFILYIASLIKEKNLQLLVRTYPSLPYESYKKLEGNPNIKLYRPEELNYVDRYGDGSEKIFFSTDEERHNYLSLCDCFLSFATSFTIEAAIDNLPIFQLYFPFSERKKIFEKEIFLRFDISDHLSKYFLSNLEIVNSLKNIEILFEKMNKNQIDFEKITSKNKQLLDDLGFNNFK